MLARSPPFTISAAPARRLKIADDRRRVIAHRIADIMRAAEPTPFAAEGPTRAGIRSTLCLLGWKWAKADAMAAEIVAAALALVGAKRPTWEQGQPSYVVDGAWRAERERCARCFKPLPEGNFLYCSSACGAAHYSARHRERMGEEILMAERARRAVWIERQPKRICEWCHVDYQPSVRDQRFCCRSCTRQALGGPINLGRKVTAHEA